MSREIGGLREALEALEASVRSFTRMDSQMCFEGRRACVEAATDSAAVTTHTTAGRADAVWIRSGVWFQRSFMSLA